MRWLQARPDPAGKAHSERLYRELQWPVQGRMPERELVRDLGLGQGGHYPVRQGYNELRPHGSIGRIPPAAFAAKLRELSTIDAGSVNLQNPGPISQ